MELFYIDILPKKDPRKIISSNNNSIVISIWIGLEINEKSR